MLQRVFSFLLFTAILHINAQVASRLRTINHNGFKVLATPDIFNRWLTKDVQQYYGNKALSVSALSSTNNKPWCVYSDRSRNELLTVQGGATGKFLEFLQPLWVSDVFGQDKLEVCGFEQSNAGPVFKKLGYVKKDMVLLSSYSCLNAYGASRHAMICYALPTKISRNANIAKIIEEGNSFYLNPNLQDKLGTPTKFRVYFVLKETGNMLLLSTKDQITESDRLSSSNVPGWINTVMLTHWDHKICLEPNFGSKVDAYLPFKKDNKLKVPIFTSVTAANTVDYLGTIDQETEQSAFAWWAMEKLHATKFRLPIIGEVKETDKRLRNVASIVKPTGTVGSNYLDPGPIISKIEKLVKKINILIVIDGSKSMEEYFTAVANSLKSITLNMKGGDFSEVRVGVAIYRDAADAANPSLIPLTKEYMRDYEFVKMTDNIESIETFLRESHATYQNINSIGPDRYESMFKGLKRAITDANFNSSESNYLLLVGDCGNHPTDNTVRIDELVNLIAAKNINIQAYQVHYGMSTEEERSQGLINPYLNFRKDIAYIIKEVSKRRIGQLNEISKYEQVDNPFIFKLELSKDFAKSEEINVYRGNRIYSGSTLSYRLNYTEDLINPSNFKTNTEKSMTLYFKGLKEQLSMLGNLGGPKKPSNSQGNDADIATLCAARSLPPDECEKLRKALENYGDFSAEGYTLSEFYNTGVRAFKTVVFMSVQEKQDLSNRLSNVIQKSGAGTERRSHFKKAVIDLVGGLMGKNDNVIIEQLTLNDIWEKSMGVKFSRNYEEIGKIPIGILDQNSIIGETEFEEFYKKFKIQVDNFKNYRVEDNIGEIGGQKIMWIPTSIFPMCDDE